MIGGLEPVNETKNTINTSMSGETLTKRSLSKESKKDK